MSPRLMSSFSSPMIVAFTSAVARVREGEGSHAQRLSALLGDVGGFGDTAEIGEASQVDEEEPGAGSDFSSVTGGPGAAGTSSYAGGASGGSSSSIREGGLGRIIVQAHCSRLSGPPGCLYSREYPVGQRRVGVDERGVQVKRAAQPA